MYLSTTAGSDRHVGEVVESDRLQEQRERKTQVSDDHAGQATTHFTRASTHSTGCLPVATAEQQAHRLPPHPCQTTHLLAE